MKPEESNSARDTLCREEELINLGEHHLVIIESLPHRLPHPRSVPYVNNVRNPRGINTSLFSSISIQLSTHSRATVSIRRVYRL
jgi:hypothetical protein